MKHADRNSDRSPRVAGPEVSPGKHAAAVAPPAYGIDLADSAGADPPLTRADLGSTPDVLVTWKSLKTLAPPAIPRGNTAVLQRTLGNSAVGRSLEASMHRAGGTAEVAPPAMLPARAGGLPPSLRGGIERLSGFDLSDVDVHYDSPQPARVGALAYAKGRDIHVGPGQERHLPHEAWHVVQQLQGRARPTMQMKGESINDDEALETEADHMGALASRAGLMGQGADAGPPPGPRGTSLSGAGAIIQRKVGDRPFADGYQKLFQDPDWHKEAESFEKKLGVFCFNHAAANAEAKAAIERSKQLLFDVHAPDMAILGMHDPDKAKNEKAVARDAFLRDDKTSAGQIGTGAADNELDAVFNNGNLRERMTAFYNSAYYYDQNAEKEKRPAAPVATDVKLLKWIFQDIVFNQKWDEAKRLGLDVDLLKQQGEYYDGPQGRRHALISRVAPGIAYSFARDIYGLGNLISQSDNSLSDLNEMRLSQGGDVKVKRDDNEKKARRKTLKDYDDLGVKLSAREEKHQDGLREDMGKQLKDQKLQWLEGNAWYKINPDSAWAEDVSKKRGMPVVTGLSGTTSRMLSSYRWLGLAQPLNFRLSIMGWMLTSWDHSLYEIMRGSHIVGVKGGEDLTDGASLYMKIPPLTTAELRDHVCEDRMFPHERVYKRQVEENNAAKMQLLEPGHDLAKVADKKYDLLKKERVADAADAAVPNSGVHDNPTKKMLGDAGVTATDILKTFVPAHMTAITGYTGGMHSVLNSLMTGVAPSTLIRNRLNTAVDFFARVEFLIDKEVNLGPLPKGEKDELLDKMAHQEEWTASLEPLKMQWKDPAGKGWNDLVDANTPEHTRRALRTAMQAEIDRVRDVLAVEMKVHANMAVEGLSALPPANNVKVYRGDWEAPVSLTYPSNVGSHYTPSGFASASREKKVAAEFAEKLGTGAFKTPVILELDLKGKGARDISYLSAVPDEAEVLLMPGSRFRLDNRQRKQEDKAGGGKFNVQYLKLTEVDPV